MPRKRPLKPEDERPEAERLAELATAVDKYATVTTAAELALAKAEVELTEAMRSARRRPALSWRAIGAILDVSHQAAMQRWKPKIRPPRRHTPVLQSTEPNRTQTTTGESPQ